MKSIQSSDFYTLFQLVKRNIKLFFKDKMTVFFSLFSPLIVLILYILFLKDVQFDAVKNGVLATFNVSDKLISGYIDSWMLSGVLAVGCVTVSLSANSIMVADKSKGILKDTIVSPVKLWVVKFGYYLYNFIITLIIMLVVLAVCLIYLAGTGKWYLGATEVFSLLGTVVFSTFSATIITVFLTDFFKTESALGAFTGIVSAVIGFLIGAYMPLDMLPKGFQYVSALLPATHSASMFREFLMLKPLEEIAKIVPYEQVIEGLKQSFSVEVNFFGKNLQSDMMTLYILGITVIFLVLNFIFFKKNMTITDKKSLLKRKIKNV